MNNKKNSQTSRTLYYYFAATLKHWPYFLLGCVATLAFVFCLSFANPLVVADIVDIIGAGGVSSDMVFKVFGPYIFWLIIANLAGQVGSKLQDYCVWKLEILIYYDLSTKVFDTLSNQSMTFHNSRFGGSLVSQTSKFTDAYNRLVEVFFYSLFPAVLSVIFTIVLLAKAVPYYVVALMAILVVYLWVVYLLYRRLLKMNAKTAGAQNRLSGELSDSITNILAVKTSGREDYEKSLFDSANKDVRAADSKRMRGSLLSGAAASAIILGIMIVLTIFISGGNAWFGISAGTLVMMYTYTYQLTSRFNMMNSVMQSINRAFGDAHDMTKILDMPRMVADDENAPDLNVSSGAINFEHINFKYADSKSTNEIFDDFTLSIPSGQRIGLVGKSGSGKTTLTRLLLRLSDVQGGQILVDGQDISHVKQISLRRQIAYVPQEPLLFHRTISENIAYGKPDASPEEIRKAAYDANALEFIEQLPDGFDTITGERGVKLSGGQRQRIAIARAILTNAPILVLDEATSALDSESEALIQSALTNLMKGRTSIVVAHRLSTVSNLDRIVVLKNGAIVEDGTHSDLIVQDGEYAKLWQRQTGGFMDQD